MFLESLKKYTTFEGRASRSDFVSFFGIVFVGAFVGGFLAAMSHLPKSIGLLYVLLVAEPVIAIVVRRLHDTGRSGWWYLIGFIPLGIIPLTYFLLQESDYIKNRFDTIGEGDVSNDAAPTDSADSSTNKPMRLWFLVAAFVAIILAVLVWFFFASIKTDKFPISIVLKSQPEIRLKSADFGTTTINGVVGELSLQASSNEDRYCKGVKMIGHRISTTTQEFTVCAKLSSPCDKIDGIGFDANEARDRVLLKYNNVPATQCSDLTPQSVRIIYKLSNVDQDGVTVDDVAINQPERKVSNVEWAISDGGKQLAVDTDLFCAFMIAENFDLNNKNSAYIKEYRRILSKYNLTDQAFIAEWKKVELRLEASADYHKKVYDLMDKMCLKDTSGDYIKQ